MPTISLFFGIIIRMYLGTKEHNPPHIHAIYQNYQASFAIDSTEIIDGDFPIKQKRLVKAWIELHRDDLVADWNLATNGEVPFKIEPLR